MTLDPVPVDERVGSFHALMQRVRDGDQEAAWTLLDTYGRFVLHVVRQNLPPRLRSKFDSMDFYQNVWASFFREPDALRKFDEPKDLVNYLRAMAKNKLGMESRRRFQTVKYDVNREGQLEPLAPTDGSSPSGREEGDLVDERQPTPSQIASVRERWNQWFAKQSTNHQEVVRLRFGGKSFEEIAQSLNINERTARRVVDALVSELES